MAIVGLLESADLICVEILNMFNTGHRPTITISVVESANSGLESADSTANSTTDPAKVGVWVRALKGCTHCSTKAFDGVCFN